MPANADSPTPKPSTSGAPIVVDLGKKRRKQIKQLRRGAGKLMDEVNGCVEELRTAGTVSSSAQPVVIVIQQKSRTKFSKMSSMFPFG